jgi:MFS transporter, ACS family, D-galactonate transporter
MPCMLTPRNWTILTLICIGFMVAYFDRVNLSVALSDPQFRSTFSLTDKDRGSLNSAFFITYAAMQVPAGWIVDRFGVRRTYALGFLLWSVLSGLTAWATTLPQLYAIRLLLGAGESVVMPASMRWIRVHSTETERGFLVGLLQASAKVGPAIGTALASYLLLTMGWQSMFLILGFGCVLWLLPWWTMLRKDPADAPLTATEKAVETPFSALLTSPAILGTLVGTFCYQYFIYFCITWLPSYFVERWNMNLNSMGFYSASTFLAMAGVATIAGWLADRLIARGGDAIRAQLEFSFPSSRSAVLAWPRPTTGRSRKPWCPAPALVASPACKTPPPVSPASLRPFSPAG